MPGTCRRYRSGAKEKQRKPASSCKLFQVVSVGIRDRVLCMYFYTAGRIDIETILATAVDKG